MISSENSIHTTESMKSVFTDIGSDIYYLFKLEGLYVSVTVKHILGGY